MAREQLPAEDVESTRRQIRAAVIAKVRIRRDAARRRIRQLVRLAHVGRRW